MIIRPTDPDVRARLRRTPRRWERQEAELVLSGYMEADELAERDWLTRDEIDRVMREIDG